MKAVDRTRFIPELDGVAVAVGRLIRERRRRMGLSQEGLAHRITATTGVPFDRQTINRVEMARYSTSVIRLVAVAYALEIRLSDLFLAVERQRSQVVERPQLTNVRVP